MRYGGVRVQRSLLPALSAPPGLTLAAWFQPAQAVGGDVYDVLPLPDGRLLVAIADVCGQGLPAALLSVVVQQGLRRFAQADPIAVLDGVNRLLWEAAPEDLFDRPRPPNSHKHQATASRPGAIETDFSLLSGMISRPGRHVSGHR